MRRLTALLTLLVPALAFGAPVDLPPGEDLSVWADALVLAGLTEGPAQGGAHVVVVVTGEGWTIRAVDASGVRREAAVPAPRTAEAREEVAILAASLLRPLPSAGAPVASTLPAPPPPVVRPRPKPAEVLPEPVPSAPPPVSEAPPAAPAPPAFRAGPWVQVGIGAELRPMVVPTVAAVVRAGAVGLPGLALGLSGEVVGPAGVDGLGVTVLGLGGGGYLAWQTATDVPILVGAEGGVAWRRFADGEEQLGAELFPWVGTTVGVVVPVDRTWAIVPEVRMAGDLRATDLDTGDDVVRLPGWSARAGVSARWGVFR